MADSFCEIKGLAMLRWRLKELTAKESKEALRKGLRAGGKIVVTAMKALVPVKSGAMKAGIKLRSARRSRTKVGVVVQLSRKTMAGDSYYAPFIEYGTKVGTGKRKHRKGTATGTQRIKPREFMQKAAKQAGKEATAKTIEVALNEMVRAMAA